MNLPANKSQPNLVVCQFEILWKKSTIEPGLLLPGCALSARCGVGRHRGADELLKGGFVDLLPFAEVDRTPRVPFQAGIEELLRVFDGGSAMEGELHDLLVRFPCADAEIMGPAG